jgi:hypothetical protein
VARTAPVIDQFARRMPGDHDTTPRYRRLARAFSSTPHHSAVTPNLAVFKLGRAVYAVGWRRPAEFGVPAPFARDESLPTAAVRVRGCQLRCRGICRSPTCARRHVPCDRHRLNGSEDTRTPKFACGYQFAVISVTRVGPLSAARMAEFRLELAAIALRSNSTHEPDLPSQARPTTRTA